jgi:membrane protein
MSNPVERRSLYARFRQVEIPTRAAALAYHTILSMIPGLGLVLFYLRAVGVTRAWRLELQAYILQHLNVASSELLFKSARQLTGSLSSQKWGWIGVLVLAYTTVNLVIKAGDSIDLIIDSHTPPASLKRKYVFILLRRLVVIVLLPAAVSLFFFGALWLRQESWLARAIDFKKLGPLASVPATILFSVVVIFLFYQFVPARAVKWQAAARAALLVAPIFEVAKVAMGYFSRHAIQVQKLYGAMAALPIFIIWVQVAWMILLCGALFIRPRDQVSPRG